MTDRLRLDELGERMLTARDKGIPASAVGRTVAEFLATGPRLTDFWTPLIALDRERLDHDIRTMRAWSAARGLELMPHGKTTMAPALWQRQLDAGCPGITLATMGQVRTARSVGLDTIMLANAAVDPRALAWLASELRDPALRFSCWADSVATVEAMERGLAGIELPHPVDVLAEVGAPGGRTGARTPDAAVALARRIAASPVLRLAGVAGYEGSLAHDRSPAALTAVRGYLESMVRLHRAIGDLYDDGEVIVTAGGSAFFDEVAEAFAPAIAEDAAAGRRTRWVLRSGAYLVHDDGFYRGISPLDEAGDAEARLLPAMRGFARVVSHPEPGLALLDGGKRDFPYDEGLPVPRAVAGDLGGPWRPLEGAAICAMNDQHSYLRIPAEIGAEAGADAGPDAGGGLAPVGSVVALGLSHPCTMFDKWQYVPMVASAADDRVVELVRTFF